MVKKAWVSLGLVMLGVQMVEIDPPYRTEIHLKRQMTIVQGKARAKARTDSLDCHGIS